MIIIVMMLMLLANNWICISSHRCIPPKEGLITFLHFKLCSSFFSATSYLIRLHPVCWVASSENSAAIPFTHLSTLLNMTVNTTRLHSRICVYREKIDLAYYFSSHSSKGILYCVSKGPLDSDHMRSSQKLKKCKKQDQKAIKKLSSKTGETAEVCGLHKHWEPLP